MALTQQQWFGKIKTFLPNWFFEEEELQEAHLQALSLVMASVDTDCDEHLEQTFIKDSEGDFLNAHGDERCIERLSGEFDAQYCVRVQRLTNQSNCPDIKTLVDSFLMVGESIVVEDPDALVFLDREQFLNREEILITEIYNAFSILVEKQVHEPFSFLDREESFMDREFFLGMQESSEYVFDLILEGVNGTKACGTLYRIIELLEN